MRYLAFQLRAPLVFAVAILWGGVVAGMPPVGTTRSGGSLVLELKVADEQLRIDLINSSDHPIKVNKRFLYGIKVAWTDVVFWFKTIRAILSRTLQSRPPICRGRTIGVIYLLMNLQERPFLLIGLRQIMVSKKGPILLERNTS